MIEVNDIRFSYGRNEVIKGVSFKSEANTVISILGPNGTGKTTFLRCMTGAQKPSSGEVLVDGTDIFSITSRELARKIAFVPQSVPPTRMSVFDTILVGRKPYIDWGASKEDMDKVTEIIDALGMSELSLKYMTEISGGEFQKAQIARAIVQEPSVLILDEPTNNLDISNQHRTMQMIMGLVRSKGMCTIMTMHDINLAVHYSDKLMFLRDGKIVAYGDKGIITEELIDEVYGIESEIIYHRGLPMVVPRESEKYDGGGAQRMGGLDPESLMHPSDASRDGLMVNEIGVHMGGFSSMCILRAAVDLGVFWITEEPSTAEAISVSVGTDADLTRMLCDSLVRMGLLETQGGRYINTRKASLYLCPGSDLYQASSLSGLFERMDRWYRLPSILRGGPESMSRDEVFGRRWLSAIAESCMDGAVGRIVDEVDGYADLSGSRTFLDLGGGHGLYAIGFVHRHPNLEATVFDTPMMCPIAESNSEAYGVPLSTIGGDFYTDDLGGPYDAVFSSFNLSTSDIRMADRVFSAVADGGILILRRHLRSTSADPIRNLEWSMSTWDGKGDKNYGGSWLPTAEAYLDRMSELGMEMVVRKDVDKTSELVIMRKRSRSTADPRYMGKKNGGGGWIG